MNGAQKFRNRLFETGAIGIFSKTSDPAFIEIMGYAGADFVIIDLEHGPNSIQTAQNLVRAAELAGSVPIVRVKEGNDSIIGEALDIGAAGIQVPQIETAVQAENVIKRMKFAPEGERGVCRFVRAAQYSANGRFKYFKRANEAVAILQIEGMSGIQNLHEILQVPGIDVLFIGPYDLSQSLGLTGQIDHPLIEEKIHEITKACMQKGVATGIFVDSPENALKWKANGVRYISYSVDTGIFYEAVKNMIHTLSKEECSN